MLIFCISLADKIIWIIPGNDVLTVKYISIPLGTRTKYFKYKCDDIIEYVESYYQCNPSITQQLIAFSISQNIFHKKEQEYRHLRETNLPFLTFNYSQVDGRVYDFMINSYKIQEKVAHYDEPNNRWMVKLSKTHGKNLPRVPYCKGDNDFYWIHIGDSTKFYIIPEKVLHDRGFISDKTQAGKKSLCLYPDYISGKFKKKIKDKWTEEYKFVYQDLDTDKLDLIFNS